MRLYLMQHGEAAEKRDDPERPLTADGAVDVKRIAEWAKRQDVPINQVWHSGKLRAHQTANIMAAQLSPPGGVSEINGLGPKDAVEPVTRQLGQEHDGALIVGHLPQLERLAARLVTGQEDRPVIRFKKAALVCLERDVYKRWAIGWVVRAEQVG